ncbi:WEB family protein At3g02930, chloroplastic isoform X2 [Oryzias melastigma]|uniref:WEB family protein At3g02930, chloroplastic isoform X2 n=1 Tax=Oryzias melastigma TaxID=30732 RepID=UPI000CF7D503|nr:WEB family protein At3g02930, chloroplastic isoform X2 [Oryzias melastigma]
MDFEEISQNEMIEKIAELDHSLSQQRDRNIQMRHFLDAADDEIAMLRLDNSTLKKQLEALKKVNSEEPQVEVEPCMCSAGDVNRCNEIRAHDLEKEVTDLKEQNKQLTEQITEERDQNKMSLSRMGAAHQSLERGLEEAQLELQQKDEIILQKDLQLNHLCKTMEEYSDIIKDLRLTKQDLLEKLEDRREEASMASALELMRADQGEPAPLVSIAEEILLASPPELTPDPEVEELQEEDVPAVKTNGQKFVHTIRSAARGTARVLLHVFSLFVFIIVLLVSCLLFIQAFPSKSYITLSYSAMPPV